MGWLLEGVVATPLGGRGGMRTTARGGFGHLWVARGHPGFFQGRPSGHPKKNLWWPHGPLGCGVVVSHPKGGRTHLWGWHAGHPLRQHPFSFAFFFFFKVEGI
jgi:hypothetical protein